MNEQKSFIYHFAEAVERYRAERCVAAPQGGSTSRASRLGRILRWFVPNGGTLLLVGILILTANVWAKPLASPAAPGPSATTVNYQGRLADPSGNPKNGTFGMTFALYDAPTGGSLVWGPESHAAVPVSDGLFSVGLGSQTGGGIPTTTWNGDRYLQITVGGEALSPRELIRSVPIAGMALTVPDGAITTDELASHAVTDVALVVNDVFYTVPPGAAWHDDPALAITKAFPGGTLLIDAALNGVWCYDSQQVVSARLVIDGVVKQNALVAFNDGDLNESTLYLQWVQNVSAGEHSIKVQWSNRFEGNCRASNGSSARTLRVINLKR